MLTDAAIAELINERKPEVDLLQLIANAKTVRGHRRGGKSITGENGSAFELAFRQSVFDATNFSVLLIHHPLRRPSINLLRFNGSTHAHLNRVEGSRVDFEPHIHRATERYQTAGHEAEGYAEATTLFSDLGGAFRALMDVAAFDSPAQGRIL